MLGLFAMDKSFKFAVMVDKEIQIVAFNNPFPPNFGGAIDLFYKIRSLSELGVAIHLHIFYDKRSNISGLKLLCKTITLYKRKRWLIKHLSTLPFCVTTRFSKALIGNLNKSEAPIIFESLRTLGVLKRHKFKQKIAVRIHNIEHEYSWGLFKSERNWFKKLAFLLEGYKLKHFEFILDKADVLFTISNYEYEYCNKNFKADCYYLPVFQENSKLECLNGFGKYALYHGDLSVSDNVRCAFFMIEVFRDLNEPLIIASSTKQQKLLNEIKKYENISFELISDENNLNDLIKNAHINTLYSFQRSGTKLKVFNALFKGRHCILNKNVVDDIEVLKICEVIADKIQYQNAVRRLFKEEFFITQERSNALKKYDPDINAKQIIQVML